MILTSAYHPDYPEYPCAVDFAKGQWIETLNPLTGWTGWAGYFQTKLPLIYPVCVALPVQGDDR